MSGRDLAGRRFVVTGANSGLGLATVHALAARGASVIMACRTPSKAEGAAAQVRAATPDADLDIRQLDLASLASIRAFAADLLARGTPIDVLVNNAGIMAIPKTRTADGFEMQLGTNHLGHFALTGQLLPLIEAGSAPRIVNVASTAHRMGKMTFDDLMRDKHYEAWAVYGQSKLANLLFTSELERRLRAAGRKTLVAAAHPGYASTELQHVGPRMNNSTFSAWLMSVGNAVFAQSAAAGALPQIHAATAPDVTGNSYWGPSGPFEMWGSRAKSVGRTSAAQSVEDARRLWDVSVQLTGETFGGI